MTSDSKFQNMHDRSAVDSSHQTIPVDAGDLAITTTFRKDYIHHSTGESVLELLIPFERDYSSYAYLK